MYLKKYHIKFSPKNGLDVLSTLINCLTKKNVNLTSSKIDGPDELLGLNIALLCVCARTDTTQK